VNLDHNLFISRLRETIEHDFPRSGEFLRIYWYDAAPRGVAQPEHDRVANQPGVKVRLGRLTRQGQKGVDSLVLRDMMRLSSEHAICTAFLVAGDEDLRQGVIEAQDHGVKVVLLGIEPTIGQNQSESLSQEADELRVLRFSEVQDCFTKAYDDGQAVAMAEGFDAYAAGFGLGEAWIREASAAMVQAALSTERLPPQADVELIRHLLELGDLPRSAQLPDSVLVQAREGFIRALRKGVEIADNAPETGGPGPEAEPAPLSGVEKETAKGQARTAPEHVPSNQLWPFTEGTVFGEAWLEAQPQEEVRYVRANFPYLPRDIDVDLIRHLVREMGLPEGGLIEDSDRRAARAGFWHALGMELDLGPSKASHAAYEPIDTRDPREFGRSFALQWASRSSSAEIERARSLLEKRIGLPSDADAALLRLASGTFGDPVPVEVKHRLREGFGEGVQSIRG
jgi:uncharacterized LabA/DUF88 family protein